MSRELIVPNPVELIGTINYSDTTLFGLSIDIFKIRLFCTVRDSSHLLHLGFAYGGAHLCFEFRLIDNLKVDIDNTVFGPPYLEDGELAAAHLLDFDFELLDLKKVGSTGMTNRIGEFRQMRDVYEVRFVFKHAELQFRFVEFELSTFEPLDLDNRYARTPTPS